MSTFFKVQAFMREWQRISTPIANQEYKDNYDYRTCNNCTVCLIPYLGKNPLVVLASLEAQIVRKGYGTQLVSCLCEMADRKQVTLRLNAEPFGPNLKRMPLYKLELWYESFGFVADEKSLYTEMKRKPKDASASFFESRHQSLPSLRTIDFETNSSASYKRLA